ncbi:putative thiazole-containing bacteriocin maturation protein [Paenibacillus sp. 1_12]|uniref:putative thiazole-containing bacteriocin maturation protein n=1 Tax=Paenibacillus sp. 1_12 TaxID=1566278 RepID=UPI0008F28AC3|nr:putative thiazole-containing bacteriocin maturation protein [Paenibacillus sp. 1_12]SFM44799.1 putative thiazole-containing bacteriocin maturation protein [Paenibacillus sp. 1_12]
MTSLTPAARLKVKDDTFFLPVPNDGVYFRNNVGTFRMEGGMIDRWIEKLVPMFSGEHTLADLTDGLSYTHRERVYEIANVLYQQGFVRDVSKDLTHQLTDGIIQKYAGQIAFLESFGDSGAYRFQCYREADVLAVGSGPIFVALISALMESGMPKIHMLITDSVPTNRKRLVELAGKAHLTDPEVVLKEIMKRREGADGWRDVVQPFQSVLYVSQEGDIEEFRQLHTVCKTEKKILLPAMCLHQIGMAGPVVHPDAEGCWESAWRRVHQPAVIKDPELHNFSSTAGAMLANVIVFELFKTVTGDSELRNSFFLLDLETLEGSWHPFMPHPLIHGFEEARTVQASKLRLDGSEGNANKNVLLTYLNRLTSAQSGILHVWEEGDLRQLPLSQCRVQTVDPLSQGPADLLPELIGTGMTHEEARRESGLIGLEAYVSRLADINLNTQEVVGIGVGETAVEGVLRGLKANLAKRHAMKQVHEQTVTRVELNRVEDQRIRYYLQALTTMRGEPVIGLGESVLGFPAVWVGTGEFWYGSTDLNITMALQKGLQAALQKVQNNSEYPSNQVLELEASSVRFGKDTVVDLVIPSSEGNLQSEILQDALQILKKNGKQLFVMDLAVEPFLQEELRGVFGVLLREGEYR